MQSFRQHSYDHTAAPYIYKRQSRGDGFVRSGSPALAKYLPPGLGLVLGPWLWPGLLLWALAAGSAVAAPPPAESPGRVVRIVIDAEPNHLNPLLDPDLWGYRIAHDLLCEPLIRRRPKSSASAAPAFEPGLAERYRLDSDGHGIELTLRPARFHDGRPVTAHDVRATIEMLRSAGGSAPRTQALLADLVRVQVLDGGRGPGQVRLDFRRATGDGILALLSELDILPAHYFPGGRLVHQPWNRRPVCSGPYRLTEWRRNNQIVLRRFADYAGPPPASDELRFLIAPDRARGLALLRKGEADLVGRVMPGYLREQVEPAVHRGRWQSTEIDANQLVAVVFNARRPTLPGPVRRALSLVFDRARLLREVRNGLGSPISGPLLDRSAADGPAGPDLATAERLLDEAGVVRLTPGGSRQFQGRPLRLRLLYPAGSTELVEVAKRLGESVARVGLRLDAEAVDLMTFGLHLRRGVFDLALLAWSWTGDDAELDLEPLLRYALPETDPALHELLTLRSTLREKSDAAETRSGRAARWSALYHEATPAALLYRPRQLIVRSPGPLPAAAQGAGGQLPIKSDFVDLRRLGP